MAASKAETGEQKDRQHGHVGRCGRGLVDGVGERVADARGTGVALCILRAYAGSPIQWLQVTPGHPRMV